MTGLLEGKAAIVTGAASGIGEASARLLAEEGAKVLAVDLPGKPLKAVHEGRANIVCMDMDVTAPEAAPKIVQAAIDAFGRLDILFNNAGTLGKGGVVETHDEADWRFVIELNMTAIYRLSKAAFPHLRQSGAARIINVGSIRSDVASAGGAAYTATKHGVAGLTKVLACELGQHGTANYIQPGAIRTGMTMPLFEQRPDYVDYWTKLASVRRLGQPEDVANAVLFLASDEASYVSGIGLWVDGGVMSHG